MSVKFDSIRLAIMFSAMLLLTACGGRGKVSFNTQFSEEEEVSDTIPSEEEEEKEELGEMGLENSESSLIDSVFNDFLFAYLHSRSLRASRTMLPLRLEHSSRPTEMLEQFDPEFEFGFLSGEYFTTLYGNAAQMRAEDDEEQEQDSVVRVQRINLNDGTIRNFIFQREGRRWQLSAIRETTFQDDDLCDFLNFYAHFSTDSIFQRQSIANPLRVSLQDPDDEDQSIDGTIHADQWQTFCAEVPGGIISNIRKSQHYDTHRMVLRKSGMSDGMEEIFTFTRERDVWRLTKYEN